MPKVNQPKLIIAIPSSRFSESMKFMVQKYASFEIEMLWLRHTRTDSARLFTPVELNAKVPQLKVVNCETSDRHAEGFFLEGVLSSGHSGWVLRLDDDELISQELLHKIMSNVESLNPRMAYSLPRIWIRKRDSTWHQSFMAKPSRGHSDRQIRLFHTDHALVDTKLHTPGFKIKRSKDLNLGLNIIHLIWEIEDLESRIHKIRGYESIEPGAGVGKMRYYLPEVFPDSRHNWLPLENQSEIDTLNAWAKILGSNTEKISADINWKETDN